MLPAISVLKVYLEKINSPAETLNVEFIAVIGLAFLSAYNV